jgi:hypothetical protein
MLRQLEGFGSGFLKFRITFHRVSEAPCTSFTTQLTCSPSILYNRPIHRPTSPLETNQDQALFFSSRRAPMTETASVAPVAFLIGRTPWNSQHGMFL